MSFHSRNAWIELGESGVRKALTVKHSVPVNQDPWLRYLHITASDGSDTWEWSLTRSNETIIEGFGNVWFDFGPEGFLLKGTAGDDIRLDIGEGGNNVRTRVIMIGIDRTAQSG